MLGRLVPLVHKDLLGLLVRREMWGQPGHRDQRVILALLVPKE